jgi:hypothetical protein
MTTERGGILPYGANDTGAAARADLADAASLLPDDAQLYR